MHTIQMRMACDSKGCMPFLTSSVLSGVSHEDNLAVGTLCTIVLLFLGNLLLLLLFCGVGASMVL